MHIIRPFLSKYWLVITVAMMTLLLVSLTSLSTFAGPQGRGRYDGLDTNEVDKAIKSVLQNNRKELRDLIGRRHEVVLVERHNETKEAYRSGEWDRRAEVYIYDYSADFLFTLLLNLETETIDEIVESQGVQLPLNENEIKDALKIAHKNKELRALLNAEHQRITGEKLSNLNQVEVKPFIFHADAMPDGINEAAANCGIHRCAQLLIYTQSDEIAFELLPIIDLSTQEVVQWVSFQLPTDDHSTLREGQHDH